MDYKIRLMKGDHTSFRYVLMSEGTNTLVAIGINPSIANEIEPDNTVKRIMGFAEGNGYDSFLMLNIYPQRSTDFSGVHKDRDDKLHRSNLKEIKKALEPLDHLDILLAFGTYFAKRSYFGDCFRDIVEVIHSLNKPVRWFQIGELTKHGYPRHPLFSSYACGFKPFDIDRFLSSKK